MATEYDCNKYSCYIIDCFERTRIDINMTQQAGLNFNIYRQISNIRRNESQLLNVCRLILKSLPNPLKPSVKWRLKI